MVLGDRVGFKVINRTRLQFGEMSSGYTSVNFLKITTGKSNIIMVML